MATVMEVVNHNGIVFEHAGPEVLHVARQLELLQAAIAQLAARTSHNPKVVSSILTRRNDLVSYDSTEIMASSWHVALATCPANLLESELGTRILQGF